MRKDNREPKPSRAERALQDMTAALRRECEKLRADLASAGTDDAKARYRLGALVNTIQEDADKYGKRGVEQLARALGFDKTLLYRHAKVASCWSLKELSELLQSESVTGLPISFSHLQLLATVTNSKKREKYVEVVLNQGLSVRKLKRLLAPRAKPEAEASSTPGAARALRRLRVASENWLQRVKLLEAEVLPALQSGPPPPEMLPEYQKTLAQQQELAEQLNKLMAVFRSWIEPEASDAAPPSRRRKGGSLQARAEAAENAQPAV
ncbi:hypothetical protein [Sorangium sp. So ce1182]|uniref:hypothetical protein n=1 Tax=Sorangium sp. So ce1182 TaxID=3133334 RepID=UPI003F601850